MGMLIQKIQRQETKVVMKPPSGGPITGPISAGMVSQASAEISSDFGTVRRMTSRPTGTIMAPPMPWTMRNSTKSSSDVRKAAGRRAEGEDDDRRAEHGARAEAVGDPAAQGNEHGERQQVRGERELERDRVFAEVARRWPAATSRSPSSPWSP